MSTDRTLVVAGDRLEAVARILRRSIATDSAEIRRLTMLGTVYHDRPAGLKKPSSLGGARISQRDPGRPNR